MRLVILSLLLLPFACFGQGVVTRPGALGAPGTAPQPGAVVEVPAEDRGSIEGQVFDAATGEPLPRTTLVTRRIDGPPGTGAPPQGYTVTSDDGGRFSLKDLDPGRYRLSANRNGYVTVEYGSRGPGRPGLTITLGRSQSLKEMNIRMTPHAVIAGRVVDENREPLARVQVQALRFRYLGGRKQLTPSGGATTNDLGEYRIFGLPAGRYFLVASARDAGAEMLATDRNPQRGSEESYVPTYYPGVIDPSSAAPVEVTAGTQLTGMELRVSKSRTVRVRGRVINTTGVQGRPATVMLVPQEQSFLPAMTMGSGRGMVDAKGTFELRGVVPGSYTLSTALFEANRSFVAKLPIQVGETNVDDLVVTLSEGMEMSGSVRSDGESKASLTGIRVGLGPRDISWIQVGPPPNAQVNEQGIFTLNNVSPDHYSVNVMNLPQGYYVKSIRTGQSSADLRLTGLDVSRGSQGAIDIVISPKAGQVSGTVMNDKASAVPGASVVLIPQEKAWREVMQSYKFITSDQNGRFTLANIEPGEYKLYAWEDMETGAYMDPDFMKPFETRGEAVSIAEGVSLDKQIKAITE